MPGGASRSCVRPPPAGARREQRRQGLGRPHLVMLPVAMAHRHEGPDDSLDHATIRPAVRMMSASSSASPAGGQAITGAGDGCPCSRWACPGRYSRAGPPSSVSGGQGVASLVHIQSPRPTAIGREGHDPGFLACPLSVPIRAGGPATLVTPRSSARAPQRRPAPTVFHGQRIARGACQHPLAARDPSSSPPRAVR